MNVAPLLGACPERSRGACPERSRGAPVGTTEAIAHRRFSPERRTGRPASYCRQIFQGSLGPAPPAVGRVGFCSLAPGRREEKQVNETERSSPVLHGTAPASPVSRTCR